MNNLTHKCKARRRGRAGRGARGRSTISGSRLRRVLPVSKSRPLWMMEYANDIRHEVLKIVFNRTQEILAATKVPTQIAANPTTKNGRQKFQGTCDKQKARWASR